MDQKITIGKLAKRTGVPPKTIRYYEQVGVLPEPGRNEAGYRMFPEIDVRRLELVRRARAMDMGLPEVKALVQLASSGRCDGFQGHLRELLHRKLAEVDHRIVALEELKQDLLRMDAHVAGSQELDIADQQAPECSLDTCNCLGNSAENQTC